MGNAVIFSGSDVKTLKSNIDINAQNKILTGSDDPRTVAKTAPKGSLYLMNGSNGGKVFRKIDDGSSTNWVEIGSGAGGINYILNPDAESSVTGWAAYADAAATTPVDGTGGSPTVTITRTTSSPLRGTGSFLITKDAANRQGEGVSVDFTIDAADKNKDLVINFDLEASANFVVGESSDIKMFVYDVTNSVIKDVNLNYIQLATYKFNAYFSSSSSTSYRLIFHVATTSASAYTLKMDNVVVGPKDKVFDTAISSWTPFTMTLGGSVSAPSKGTASYDYAQWRRVGDSMEVVWVYRQTGAGSNGSGLHLYKLPENYRIDTARFPVYSSHQWTKVGEGFDGSGSTTADNPSAVMVYNDQYVYFAHRDGSGTYQQIGSSYGGIFGTTNAVIAFRYTVPILGWGSSIQLASTGTFRLSNLLANGTRVTTTPTKLGEYRSRSKTTGSSNTYADAAPTTAISSANGLRLHAANYSGAQTSGEISLYDIFIGNRVAKLEVYSTTGFSGALLFDHAVESSTVANGTRMSYDKATGVLTIEAGTNISTNTSRGIGISTAGTQVTDGYIDAVVSEAVQTVGFDSPREEVWLTTYNGHGSTATKILRFSTIQTQMGSTLTITQSATNGDSITIGQTGVYCVTAWAQNNVSTTTIGVSRNSNQLTTDVLALTAGHALVHTSMSQARAVTTAVVNLNAGDVIRAHSDGSAFNSTAEYAALRVTKVSN